MSKVTMDKQILELADSIGDFIEYWGFKKVHGRIWALVFLAERPVDANYLIQHLSISKALVSISVKDLLNYNVILESDEKKSTTHYITNPDLVGVITDVLMGREAKMILKIKNSCELASRMSSNKLGEHATIERINKLSNMVGAADKTLKTLLTLKQVSFNELSSSLSINSNRKE